MNKMIYLDRCCIATKDAKLVHYIKSRGAPKPPVTFHDTMRIRHRLKKELINL